MPERSYEVVVVGGGPAGLAAAVRAAEAGRSVAVVDDNPAPGGQIWRADGRRLASPAQPWLDRLRAAGGEVLVETAVVHAESPQLLWADHVGEPLRLRAGRLVLATGARERFLPFPGWTLPGVFGAGGLQALVKGGWQVAGRRVAVAGSGPLLLAVAAALRRRGAEIVCLAEQAPLVRLLRFAVLLLSRPAKLVQLAGLERALRGVPRYRATWPLRALGEGRVEGLTLASVSGVERTVHCDAVACGFDLLPETRLASLLGCARDAGRVLTDDTQTTSVAGVYCAGEPTGIGGGDLALVEGEIAGLAAAGEAPAAHALPSRLVRRRRRERRFAAAMKRAFALRPELRDLAAEETVVCRCEDVTWGEIRRAAVGPATVADAVPAGTVPSSTRARDLKLRTRCGMGACQGRVCGAALEVLCGFEEAPVRPPLFPVPLSFWAEIPEATRSEFPERRSP